MGSGKKKGFKAVIIAAAAVVIAAAVGLSVYFFWYKPSKNETHGGGSDKKIDIGLSTDYEISYETAEYNGSLVPKELLKYLEEADKKSESLCKSKGVALTVAGHRFSVPEFSMIFSDVIAMAVNGAFQEDVRFPLESTDIPSEIVLDKDKGITWADKLRDYSVDILTERYLMFDEALAEGIMLTDSDVEQLTAAAADIEQYAKNNLKSADEYISSVYNSDIGIDIYMRNSIATAYAQRYIQLASDKFFNSLTEEEIEAKYKSDTSAYDYVDVYILPMNKDASSGDRSGIESVTSLSSFLDAAVKYYSTGAMPVSREEAIGQFQWQRTRYFTLEKKMGGEVAKWCFAPGRKAGDTGVVSGAVYDCLIYVVKPAYNSYSVNLHRVESYYDSSTLTNQPTDEQYEASRDLAKGWEKEFAKTDKTVEDIEQFAVLNSQDFFGSGNGGGLKNVRIGEMEHALVDWCFNENRKPGDFKALETSVGYFLYYFDGANTDDLDYVYYIKSDEAADRYNEYLESLKAFNGNEVLTNQTGLNSAIKMSESSIDTAENAEK